MNASASERRARARAEFIELVQQARAKVAGAAINQDPDKLILAALDYLISLADEPHDALRLLAKHVISQLPYERQKLLWSQADRDRADAIFRDTLLFDSREHSWQRLPREQRRAHEANPANWCPARSYLRQRGMRAAYSSRQVMRWFDKAAAVIPAQRNWRGEPVSPSGEPLSDGARHQGHFAIPIQWVENTYSVWRERQRRGGGRPRERPAGQ